MTKAPTPQHRHRVLIVDDDSGIRNQMGELLRRAGFIVETAANGMHALTKLNSGFKADLIITDLIMAGMNGSELVKNIRSHPDYKSIPVMLMTGAKERSLVSEVATLGLSHLLFKPINYPDFTKKILSFFNTAKTQVAA
jgi:two-component system chemotaxis response regulator CheY